MCGLCVLLSHLCSIHFFVCAWGQAHVKLGKTLVVIRNWCACWLLYLLAVLQKRNQDAEKNDCQSCFKDYGP